MAIDNSSPGRDCKVFVTIQSIKRTTAYNTSSSPFPRLNFECNVGIKYVPDTTDASFPDYITELDSRRLFHLPLDLFSCGDNFSSYQPRTYISYMLRLMEIPFKLDRLFLKFEDQGKEEESTPLESSDKIVTIIFNAACARADAVGYPGQSQEPQLLLVRIEKVVIVPHSEYVGLFNAKQEDLFSKVRNQFVRTQQLEKEGQKIPESEWKNRGNVAVKSGFGREAMLEKQRAALMKHTADFEGRLTLPGKKRLRQRPQCRCEKCAGTRKVGKKLP